PTSAASRGRTPVRRPAAATRWVAAGSRLCRSRLLCVARLAGLRRVGHAEDELPQEFLDGNRSLSNGDALSGPQHRLVAARLQRQVFAAQQALTCDDRARVLRELDVIADRKVHFGLETLRIDPRALNGANLHACDTHIGADTETIDVFELG